MSTNLQRRHLSADDKRKLIADLIKAMPEKSDRQIAEMLKVSPTTVGRVRAEMEPTVQDGQLPPKRVGKDGKTRRVPTRPRRRTADDFRRDLQAKKDRIATAMPGDIGPTLPEAPPPVVLELAADDDVCRAVVDCVADVIKRVNETLTMPIDASQRERLFGSLRQAIADLERDDHGPAPAPPVASEAAP